MYTKSPENFLKNPKHGEINAKNIFFKEKNLCQEVYRELPMKYTEGYLCIEFDGIILIYETMNAKN